VIHDAIIDVLTDFASNVTRYYNLELLIGGPHGTRAPGPVQAWHERVVGEVAAAHYPAARRRRHEARATEQERLFGKDMRVMFFAESGAPIESVYEASRLQSLSDATSPWVRMYVMQINRFVAIQLSDIGDGAPSHLEVPHFPDFFGIFFNSDTYFRTRATWSIYG
jgi:hypothetical protein